MSDDEDVKSLDTRAPVEHDDDVDDDAKTIKKPAADCDGAVTIKKKTNTAGRRKQVNPKKHNKLKLSADAADGTKRKRRYKPGTVALRQIRKYQKSTENLLPRATFKRLVKEITAELTDGNAFFEDGVRFKSDAVDALQVAAESEIVTLFNVANSLNIDIGNSLTLSVDSLRVAFNLRNADHRVSGGLAGFWNSRHGSILP
jgi:histone H3/H4